MTKGKIIQIVQWLIILSLAICCFWFWRSSKNNNENLIQEELGFNKTDTQYVQISNDKDLKELKKMNEVLHDSIKKLSNVKEAVQIKYIIKRDIDTVFLDNSNVIKDSIYHYSQVSDTINYDLDIKGKEVEWFKLDFSIQDSLMLVTRSVNNQNETTITHTPNTDIQDATVFVPKKKFVEKVSDRLYYGIGVGAGYGLINKKPDIYIGINAGIRF